MALIMLAIGGLLTLLGVYAMATGFPVIEIERGWSMVIAGAVLLSGGLIVAALGIVVRTLGGLKLGLPAASAIANTPHPEPAFAPAAIPVQPPAPPPAPLESTPAFGVAAPAAAAALAAGAGAFIARQPEPEPAAAEPLESPLESSYEAREHVAHAVDDPLPSDADHAAPALAKQAIAEPAPDDRPGHDWLDREFAAFDLDAPHPAPATPEPPQPGPPQSELPQAEPAPEEPRVPSPTAHEPPAPDHQPEVIPPSEPEPLPEPRHEPVDAPATAPDTPPGTLTVIGRYDSEGTSYVMYSDGSIEAQSEAGVFRFGSMAELKAFIEG